MTVFGLAVVGSNSPAAAQVPDRLKPWLTPQEWERDTDSPMVLPLFGVGASIVNRASGRICDSFSDHQFYPNDRHK